MRKRRLFRGIWFLLGALELGYAAQAGWSPVSTVSMSCRKVGEPELDLARAGIACTDSLFAATGATPLVLLALLLGAPLVSAGIALNRRVSWCATGVLALLAVYGLFHWTGFWGLLLFGAMPGAIASAVVSAFQLPAGQSRPTSA